MAQEHEGAAALNVKSANDIKVIANVGTGTMGHAIALQFALAGYQTRLVGRSEASLDRGMARIRSDAETFAGAGLLRAGESVDDVLARITPVVGYEQGVADADFVIESVAENRGVKQDVWREIARSWVLDLLERLSYRRHRNRRGGGCLYNP
ncbi:3-hydroxyacyl-CoA dehydrogenase NAD-binding domain-containing protein [Bifidobacterium callitrichidarum]|uniref:3-hydroxyacyl-CoA dehydrogenase n=1 Tax=Bifidobacterium callitrichidarum TaxID=2052941 RepID=A0A2U2N7Z8_9BIFI|nr:3-hydroxyacyl-CoA dehydrogenase NAD-binding domain-containing protein [Bifidobacterium callitrichidarum]PWG65084.1 3-hydroxyacyl-CoA dehydrogenase [Bifidobacterium callitrichidarum]